MYSPLFTVLIPHLCDLSSYPGFAGHQPPAADAFGYTDDSTGVENYMSGARTHSDETQHKREVMVTQLNRSQKAASDWDDANKLKFHTH